MSAEAILATAYAAFLAAAALGLDFAARHSHRRSGRYRTAGFRYRPELDGWECPEGEFLRRVHLDQSARVVRYRARAAVCNACPAKGSCTDSDEGREVVSPLDPWPHSEAGRFHRGLSVSMLVLAALVLAAATARNATPASVVVLLPSLLIIVLLAVRMLVSFRATAANIPGAPVPAPLAAEGSKRAV